jgi:biotin synthase-like enzyme
MFVSTTWKARPLSPDQSQRMMETWAKTEAKEAENASSERVCWFIAVDGSSGLTVSKVTDADAAIKLMLEVSLALGEFIELDSNIVLDLDTAMPAITDAMAYAQ